MNWLEWTVIALAAGGGSLVLAHNRHQLGAGEYSISIAPVNGGLAGIKRGDPEVLPLVGEDGKVKSGQWRVIRNSSFFWSPAISTGLVFRATSKPGVMAGGIGVHFVAFGDPDGTRTAPAVTFHYGTSERQGFIGGLFTATGDMCFPASEGEKQPKELTVAAGTAEEAAGLFVTKRTKARPGLFGGIAIEAIPTSE